MTEPATIVTAGIPLDSRAGDRGGRRPNVRPGILACMPPVPFGKADCVKFDRTLKAARHLGVQ